MICRRYYHARRDFFATHYRTYIRLENEKRQERAREIHARTALKKLSKAEKQAEREARQEEERLKKKDSVEKKKALPKKDE